MPAWLLPAILGATMVTSYMGSMRRMQTLDTAAQWDKYNQKIKTSYKTIQANERARLILSMKRAAQGARGVVIATGSTLIENNAVIDRLEDTVWWIEKGAEMDVRDIDLRLAGLLQEEAWKTGESLISGGLKIAELYP
jgi:acyl CoA:acetate/3-ketoacid CoA transferase alpha subunit